MLTHGTVEPLIYGFLIGSIVGGYIVYNFMINGE